MNTYTAIKIVTEEESPDLEKLKAFLISLLKTNKIIVTILLGKNSKVESIWNLETNTWTYRPTS